MSDFTPVVMDGNRRRALRPGETLAPESLPATGAAAAAFTVVEINVGSTFLPCFEQTLTDARATPTSVVLARVTGKPPSDGRSVDEIEAEDVSVFARAGAGTVKLTLRPAVGMFSGRYVVAYQLSN